MLSLKTEIPDFDTNKVFYNVPRSTKKDYVTYSKNIINVYDKVHKSDKKDKYKSINTTKRSYKGVTDMLYIDRITKNSVFDKQFTGEYVTKLMIESPELFEIKTLPKELKVLYIIGSTSILNFTAQIPKDIISISALSCALPQQFYNLSKLKKLKVFSWEGYFDKFPKFPKNIEYIKIEGYLHLYSFSKILNGFKLKNFPKLKYFDVKRSGIRKEDIPQEWKDAKKSKKLKIYY